MPKRVLVVTCIAPRAQPEACTHGVYQRFAGLLQGVAKAGAEIHVLAIYRPSRDPVLVTAGEFEEHYLSFAGVSVTVTILALPPGTPVVGRLRTFVAGLVDPFGVRRDASTLVAARQVCQPLVDRAEVILCHRLISYATTHYLAAVAAPVVLDLDDVEDRLAFRQWQLPPFYLGKLVYLSRVLGLASLERQVTRRCAATFVCSEVDRRWLEGVLGGARVQVLPNAVEHRAPGTVTPPSRRVLFLGAMVYEPNAEAARYLVHDLWPVIHRACPGATLSIVGAIPDAVTDLRSDDPSVDFAGYVLDLDPVYAAAQLVVCPLRVGGGTRVKIIEAAMYGRAVVSTAVGAEGLAFTDPAEIRIRNAGPAFADECIRLLGDVEECRRIGAAAHAIAQRRYSRDAFVRDVSRVIAAAGS